MRAYVRNNENNTRTKPHLQQPSSNPLKTTGLCTQRTSECIRCASAAAAAAVYFLLLFFFVNDKSIDTCLYYSKGKGRRHEHNLYLHWHSQAMLCRIGWVVNIISVRTQFFEIISKTNWNSFMTLI